MPALFQVDELQNPELLGFIRALAEPNNYLGSKWLPNLTTSQLEVEYILGSSRTPVMATILGWDSEAPLHATRAAGEKVRLELPPIKRKARFGEKTLIKFLQPRAGSADVDDAINESLDMAAELVDTVFARMEWLRLQALSEDKVVYNEDGVIFQFDYGINDRFQINLVTEKDGAGTSVASEFSTVWSDHANSEWVNDLIAICNRVEAATGVRPVELVGGSEMIGHMLANEHARTLIRGTSGPSTILTRNELDQILSLYNLPAVTTYSTRMQAENPDGTLSDVQPLAPNKAFLVPGGGPVAPRHSSIGASLWGPTAESRELIGTPLISQAPGIYAKTYGKEDPPEEYVKVAAVAFPSMPGADKLAQMTLWSA